MNFFNKQSLSSSSSHAPALFQTLQGSYLRQELFFSVSWLLSWSLHLQAMLSASLMSSSASLLGIKCQNHLFVYSHNPYMLFFGVTVPKQRTPPHLWWRHDFNVMDTVFHSMWWLFLEHPHLQWNPERSANTLSLSECTLGVQSFGVTVMDSLITNPPTASPDCLNAPQSSLKILCWGEKQLYGIFLKQWMECFSQLAGLIYDKQ